MINILIFIIIFHFIIDNRHLRLHVDQNGIFLIVKRYETHLDEGKYEETTRVDIKTILKFTNRNTKD